MMTELMLVCTHCKEPTVLYTMCTCEGSMMDTAATLLRGVNAPELIDPNDWIAGARAWLEAYDESNTMAD